LLTGHRTQAGFWCRWLLLYAGKLNYSGYTPIYLEWRYE